MNKIILLACILFFLKGITQNQKATIFFKDGSELTGLAKITKFNEIKFKENKESKQLIYDSKTVTRIIIEERTHDIEYIYKTIIDRKNPVLLEPLEKGLITIYKEDQINFNGSISVIIYMSKNYGSIAFKLGYVSHKGYKLFDKEYRPEYNTRAKNIIKKVLNEAKDCPKLTNKIKETEFKKFGVLDIVKYYNKNCGL